MRLTSTGQITRPLFFSLSFIRIIIVVLIVFCEFISSVLETEPYSLLLTLGYCHQPCKSCSDGACQFNTEIWVHYKVERSCRVLRAGFLVVLDTPDVNPLLYELCLFSALHLQPTLVRQVFIKNCYIHPLAIKSNSW